MLNESSIFTRPPVQANVGLTAYQVAAVQAKVFEKTLSDVTRRQEQTLEEQARKSEEQRQKVREQIAEARGGVDFVVERSESVPAKNPVPTPGTEVNPQTNKVNFEV